MSSFLPTIILRHRKENLKKCSLKGLENHPGILFYTYPTDSLPLLDRYVTLYLSPDATKPLSKEDAQYGLFLLDSTWHYEATMHQTIKNKQTLEYRSLPEGFLTAYPRKQTECIDPERGLSTIEALYIAYTILGHDTSHLFDHYYWKQPFLEKNAELLSSIQSSSL